jgi:hypothetical protein
MAAAADFYMAHSLFPFSCLPQECLFRESKICAHCNLSPMISTFTLSLEMLSTLGRQCTSDLRRRCLSWGRFGEAGSHRDLLHA